MGLFHSSGNSSFLQQPNYLFRKRWVHGRDERRTFRMLSVLTIGGEDFLKVELRGGGITTQVENRQAGFQADVKSRQDVG
jgi:hypothetical protein